MSRPTVSILVPTYNHDRFIGQCLESVLAQSFPDWEMIVIDDGSTDRTPEVISHYTDPRIQVIRQANKGITRLAESYRGALELARGKLVTILSGDDFWPADRLEAQVPVFEEAGVAACFGVGVMVNEAGREIARVPRGRVGYVLNRPVGSLLRVLLVNKFLPSYTYLISRKALDLIGGLRQPEGVLAVDSPTIMSLALHGEFRYIDRPMGYWRVHGGQSTAEHRLRQARGDTAYALRFFHGLDDRTKALVGWSEPGLARVLDRCFANAYFETGRRCLLGNQRSKAMRQFGAALVQGALATKMKACVGLACAVTGFDLERVVRLAGRTALR